MLFSLLVTVLHLFHIIYKLNIFMAWKCCECAALISYLQCQHCFVSVFLSAERMNSRMWWWAPPLPCVCQWRCWEPCDPDHPSIQAHCNITPAPTLTGPNDLTQTPVCLSWRCFYFFLSPPASLSSVCLTASVMLKTRKDARKLRERKVSSHMLCRLKTHGLHNEYLRKL